jgi:thioester reductase-like protein
MTSDVLFISGGTGALGTPLLKLLVPHFAKVYVLTRKDTRSKTRSAHCTKTVILMPGNVTQTNLGIASHTLKQLQSEVTHIINGAAHTRFSSDYQSAHKVNVIGTREMLAFATSCAYLQAFGHISTVHVSGTRHGIIAEHELIDKGFVNNYERTKFESEKLIRSQQSKLPIAVYRISTLIGDSKTGFIERVNSVHQMIRLYYKGLVPMIPGNKNCSIDLLSTDYAARAITHLFLKSFTFGTTYHIVSGKTHSYTLKELLQETTKLLNKHDTSWGARGIDQPPIVTKETYEFFTESIFETQDAILISIINGMNYFIPHLSFDTAYDTTNTDKQLKKIIPKQHVSSYYNKVIAYCIQSDWGKHNVNTNV